MLGFFSLREETFMTFPVSLITFISFEIDHLEKFVEAVYIRRVGPLVYVINCKQNKKNDNYIIDE